MPTDGELLYAAVQTAWKDDAISSGSTSKERRANLKRVQAIETPLTAGEKKRRRKAKVADTQPLFIAKRKEAKTKKNTDELKPKLNKKQREKIAERNATMKETYEKILGGFAAKSTSDRRDIAEYDAARGVATWNDVRCPPVDEQHILEQMLNGRADFYKEKDDVDESVFSEADFNQWQKSYDVRSQIKRKLQ